MALVAFDLDEADVGGHCIERVHDGAALACRVEPVARERHHAEARLGALEGVGQHVAVFRGEVEVIHRAGDVEVAVGVKAIDERRALVAEVAFHLEVGVEREAARGALLQVAAELAVQRLFRQVRDVRRMRATERPLRGTLPCSW